MNDKINRKKRMEELILKNKMNRKKEYGELFDECIEALQKEVNILSDSESEEMYDNLQRDFPFIKWGRIDWEKVDKKFKVNDIEEINSYIQTNMKVIDDSVYVLWGYRDSPVIRTKLISAMGAIDDINVIGGDQWIYSPHDKYVIEFYHEGEIMIGYVDYS
ncbi:MAG: hypothetical protein N4A50_01410 [Vallitalea sp.]|jgi:hypothetical protein|nr:hypothetical protein [Vallitalea sp.]